MSDERRYSDSEVERIFERAAERGRARSREVGGEGGLTLPELQEIGSEVGLAPDAVAEAARALDRPDDGIERSWGLPLSVRRTVPLPREPSEADWERLVADLRQTFGARGKVERHGGLRQWTNGNLHALLEPDGSGYRLRMGTTKGSARQLLSATVAVLGAALFLVIVFLLRGKALDLDVFAGPTVLSLVGLGTFGAAALQLPGWSRTRLRQMDEIAGRITASMAEETGEDGEDGEDDEA